MLELNRKFLPFYNKKARYKFARGGRAGSKSHNVALILLMKGKDKKQQIVCLREFQKNLEESVYRLLCNKIREDSTLTNFYKIMSDRIIGNNGTEFTFSGIKNAKNFKSFEGADIAWVEEAQTLSQESIIILVPTVRKPGSEIWFTYNPDNENDPVHKMADNQFRLDYDYLIKLGFDEQEIIAFQKEYDTGQIVLNINYYDNPHCPAIMKAEARQMELIDYDLYRHVWLGECRQLSDAIIYKDKFEILDFDIKEYQSNTNIPMFNNEFVTMRYGLDFGWVHPSAVVQSFRYSGCIYVVDEIVGKEMDCDDITQAITSNFKWFKLSDKIFADSARPDLIAELTRPRANKFGAQLPSLNIESANKCAGSVESGITWLKTHQKIYIHPRCKNTIDNFRKYSYKKDKNDTIVPQIIKLDDDCLDALRYSYNEEITQGGGIDWTKFT